MGRPWGLKRSQSDRLMGGDQAVGLCSLTGDGRAVQGVQDLWPSKEKPLWGRGVGLASGSQTSPDCPGTGECLLSPISEATVAAAAV